jgi:hypothetical protein
MGLEENKGQKIQKKKNELKGGRSAAKNWDEYKRE